MRSLYFLAFTFATSVLLGGCQSVDNYLSGKTFDGESPIESAKLIIENLGDDVIVQILARDENLDQWRQIAGFPGMPALDAGQTRTFTLAIGRNELKLIGSDNSVNVRTVNVSASGSTLRIGSPPPAPPRVAVATKPRFSSSPAEKQVSTSDVHPVSAPVAADSNDGEPWYRFKWYCPKKIGTPSSSESGALEILQVVREEDENWLVIEPHFRVTRVDPIYKVLLLKRARYQERGGVAKYQHEYDPWIALQGINGEEPFVWKAPAIRIPREVKFEDRREPGGFYMGTWDSEKQRYTLGNWPSDGSFHLRHEKEQFAVGVECVSRLNTEWGSARNNWKVVNLP